MRIFVAGASGAIGQRLVPKLVAQGHHVVATTRTPAKADGLTMLGAEPVVVDLLDAPTTGSAPSIVSPSAFAGVRVVATT